MKLLIFTLIVAFLSLPIVGFDLSPQGQEAEASGIHWFLDHHWDEAHGSIFPKMHWWTKWNWHFWERWSAIHRHFCWQSQHNAYYRAGNRNLNDVFKNHFGTEFPTWAKWAYPADYDEIHTYQEYNYSGTDVMTVSPKYLVGHSTCK